MNSHRLSGSRGRNLLLPVLKARNPRSRCWLMQLLVGARFLAILWLRPTWWREREGSLHLFSQGLNLLVRAPPDDLTASQRHPTAGQGTTVDSGGHCPVHRMEERGQVAHSRFVCQAAHREEPDSVWLRPAGPQGHGQGVRPEAPTLCSSWVPKSTLC